MLDKIEKRIRFPGRSCLFNYQSNKKEGLGCLVLPAVQSGLGLCGCYMFFNNTLINHNIDKISYNSCIGPLSCIEDSVWSMGLFKIIKLPTPIYVRMPNCLIFYNQAVMRFYDEYDNEINNSDKSAHGIAGVYYASSIRDHGLPHNLPSTVMDVFNNHGVRWINSVDNHICRVIEIR